MEQETTPITAIVCSAPKCTDGSEEHKWDGPVVMRGNMGSVSCSKCGVLAFDVDNYMGGYF
jgi:hypothetical protein